MPGWDWKVRTYRWRATKTYLFLQIFQPWQGIELSFLLSFHSTHNFPLHKHRESFIEPEMFEISIGHQISRPRMGNFVRDNWGERFITSLNTVYSVFRGRISYSKVEFRIPREGEFRIPREREFRIPREKKGKNCVGIRDFLTHKTYRLFQIFQSGQCVEMSCFFSL